MEHRAYYAWLYAGTSTTTPPIMGSSTTCATDATSGGARGRARVRAHRPCEAAYEPERVQFYRLVDIPFARELRKVSVEHPFPGSPSPQAVTAPCRISGAPTSRPHASGSRSWSARFACSPTCAPGEGVTALVMVANVFLILCAYYFVKPLRDGWIAIADIGGISTMEVKAYTSFAQGLFLAAASPPTRGSRRAGRAATLIIRTDAVLHVEPAAVLAPAARLPGRATARARRRLLHLGRDVRRVRRVAVLGLRRRFLQPTSAASGCCR